ncbi:MAG TPA: exosortase E/protease, VPEID-CTERM system [Bryobacteraceae bacterium]|nr:exosortase E/protease, VPEID-CTERM system [Bryobacteraceae bacterium]
MPVADSRPSNLPARAELFPLFGVRLHPRSLLSRILSLTFLFAVELVVISVLLDSASLNRAGVLPGLIRDWGPWVLRGIVGGAAIFATFLGLKHPVALDRISAELERAPIAWPLLAVHAIAMAAFAALSFKLYSGDIDEAGLLAAGWLVAGAAAIVCASLAALPWGHWVRLIASGGRLWAYALVSTVLACIAGSYSRALWQPAAQLTFTLSKWILKPLVSGLIVNPALPALGTSRFRVIVAPECSGLEGAGLILAFGIVWLLLFRRECRFPQSLLLIPASVVVLFLLNAVRIAALVLIGDAGARQIAVGGFHSQAGWILFNAVAVGFCVTVRNVAWFTTQPMENQPVAVARPAVHAGNPTAAYLVPFLAILATGMIATAASGGFEWLYPLKLFAAAIALWMFRKQYAGLDWRPSWLAVAAGAAAFGVWIASDRLLGAGTSAPAPVALASVTPAMRTAWIVLRATAAVSTVPLAEELAFRGFLMRRFTSADFETVPFQSVGWFALVTSSVAFGVLHGGQRIAATLTGIVFGLMLKRRGSMGDAVAAHAVANAMLAAYVLIYGQWQLW